MNSRLKFAVIPWVTTANLFQERESEREREREREKERERERKEKEWKRSAFPSLSLSVSISFSQVVESSCGLVKSLLRRAWLGKSLDAVHRPRGCRTGGSPQIENQFLPDRGEGPFFSLSSLCSSRLPFSVSLSLSLFSCKILLSSHAEVLQGRVTCWNCIRDRDDPSANLHSGTSSQEIRVLY